MKEKLFSNSIFYSLIGFLPVTIGFFTLPIMTRYLSPDEYAIFSMVAAFTTMISIAATFQIYSGVSRLFFDYKEEDKKIYFSTLFYSISLISSLVFILFLLYGDILVSILYPKANIKFYPFFFISLIGIFFSLPIGITTAFFKVQQKGRQLLLISTISSLVSVAITLYLVVAEGLGATGGLIGSSSGAVISYFMHITFLRSNFVCKFKKQMFIENLKFGLPVIPHALGGYLFMYSDIIVLEKYVVISMIGIYAISNKFATLLKTVVNSFSSAFNPIFMKSCKDSVSKGQELVTETTKSWFVILGIGYIIICHLGEHIIYLLTPTPYHQAALILPVLAISYVFRGVYIMLINTFYFKKVTKYLPIATLSSGILNVGLNILLIPHYGIWAAAITTAICFAINWAVLEILSLKSFRVKFDPYSSLFLLTLVVISNAIFYLAPSEENSIRLIVQISFILSVMLFVWFSGIGKLNVIAIEKIRYFTKKFNFITA